jgi:hypothetical protein
MADDHRPIRRAWPLFRRCEIAAQHRPDAHGLEVAGRDNVNHRLAGGAVFGDTAERHVVRRDIRERPLGVADVHEARIGERAIAPLGRAVLAVDADDLTRRIGAGERADQQAIDDAEDAGVDPDAQCQHPDSGQREAGMFGEQPEAIAKVLPEGPHRFTRRATDGDCFTCWHL